MNGRVTSTDMICCYCGQTCTWCGARMIFRPSRKNWRRLRRAIDAGQALISSCAGLDPRIRLLREKFVQRWMDCRVKPGNDRGGSPNHTNITIDPVVLRDSISAWARGASCKG